MKFLYLYQLDSTRTDIPEALQELGHSVAFISRALTDTFENADIQAEVRAKLESGQYAAVLSFNFYPYISDTCEQLQIPYIAWLFDSPVMYAYTKSILNGCNHIFCFDRKFCESLTSAGVSHVVYMPLAANPKRLSALKASTAEYAGYNHDITFVGRLFQDNNFNILSPKISPAYQDYFNKLFQLQYMTPDRNIFYTMLSPNAIAHLRDIIPNSLESDYPLADIKKCYADVVLSRKYTELERTNLLQLISGFHPVHFYTDSDTSMLPNVINKGGIECTWEAPKLFSSSKINLNFTQISIESGLPLRVFDIIGAGGFLISNAQSEFNEHFIPGEEVVLYHSREELVNLIEYYLTHKKERIEIARQGLERIISSHTYPIRLQEILTSVFAD